MIFRLLIAVPCMDYLNAEFVRSLVKLTGHLQREGVDHTVEILPGTLVYIARNRLAKKAVQDGYTHLLFLDSDMLFDENIVETLRFSGKDFVCGAYQARRPPYASCIFKRLNPIEKVTEYGMEPFRVEGCGMGCALIGVNVLKSVIEKYGNPFDPENLNGISYGEDLAFCWKAIHAGHEIWCDPTARCGHVAHVPIWPGEAPAT